MVLYAAGADDNALANYIPAALKGSARSWLVHLPPRSMSHPDFCFRIYKLFNKLLLEFILNVH
jgi:hypothetical protein